MQLRLPLLAVVLILFLQLDAQAQEIHKIVNNGPDGAKLVIAVLGEGYSKADKQKYLSDVERLVVRGLLSHDFYREHQNAFNIYRVDLWSQESGLSHPGAAKKTALDLTFTGNWIDSYFKEGNRTESGFTSALQKVPKYDYVIAICNEKGFGGCGGSRIYITRGVDWPTVCHEFGHAIGRLYDEYAHGIRVYSGSPINFLNASTFTDRKKVSWSRYVAKSTPVPTPEYMLEPDSHVGVYEGGNTYSSGVYRPGRDCRMRTNFKEFCPVCRDLMAAQLAPYLAPVGQPYLPGQGLEKFMHFEFRVNDTGMRKWSLSNVSEVSGSLTQQNHYPSSDYIVESYGLAGSNSAQWLIQDPFLKRGFPTESQKDENVADEHNGVVRVSIPNVALEQAKHQQLGIRFYKLKKESAETGIERISMPILPNPPAPPIKPPVDAAKPEEEIVWRMDSETLNKLKKEDKVLLLWDFKPEELAASINKVLNR